MNILRIGVMDKWTMHNDVVCNNIFFLKPHSFGKYTLNGYSISQMTNGFVKVCALL